MTVVLAIPALGGGPDFSTWLTGWFTRDGRELVTVPSAADLSPRAIPDAADRVDELVDQYRGEDILITGHSQGCQVAGEVLARWLEDFNDAPSAKRVSFLLTGNLERARYGYIAKRPRWIKSGNSVRTTPEDTPYRVLDIGRRGDLWANYPGGVLALGGLLLCPPHLNYRKVNPDALDVISELRVGNTHYVNVS